MNISKLVKKAKHGNKEALVKLIMHEKQSFYKLALVYVGNEHDALDALENMIVILYRKIEQLHVNEAFYRWSKTILVNECRAILKRKTKFPF